MKISIFQLDTIWNDKDANLHKIQKEITHSDGIDLFLLPEMFNTGFMMEPEGVAEPIDGHTITFLATLLKGKSTIIGGTIPSVSEHKFYNSFVFVDQSGIIDYYSKMHLYSPAGESQKYKSGGRDLLLPINNVLIKPLICYDLRFPYISFNKYEKPFDILIYSANWPKTRIDQWEKLLMARAIENQCYVIGINRVGVDANGYEYPGHSMVINYKGEVLLALDNQEQNTAIDLDIESMVEYRKRFPFLQDKLVF
jgi:omega-amidase